MMRRTLRILALACLFTGLAAHADETTKRAKVKDLFRLTFMEKRAEQTRAAALAQANAFGARQFAALKLPETENRTSQDYYKALYALIASKYDWAKLEPAYEQIYVTLYSEEELDGILAFYKSPVGQTMLAKTPEATRRILEVSSQQVDSLTPAIQKLTEDYLARLQAVYQSQQR